MTKTLIAVPCFDMVHTDFFESFTNLVKPDGTSYTVVRDTLINESRNIIAANAVKGGFDRVMWFDSDMKFEPDTLVKLSADMDTGIDYVTGLYFTRRPPIKPCVFKELWWTKEDGTVDAGSQYFFDYKKEGLHQIAGSGFGCVMTSVDLIKKVGDKFGAPFNPLEGMGEDLSFCCRVVQLGVPMWIDTRVKCGHVGQFEYNEAAYDLIGLKETDVR